MVNSFVAHRPIANRFPIRHTIRAHQHAKVVNSAKKGKDRKIQPGNANPR
jgi:hypothetical protein